MAFGITMAGLQIGWFIRPAGCSFGTVGPLGVVPKRVGGAGAAAWQTETTKEIVHGFRT